MGKLSEFGELDAVPSAGDMLAILDVSDTSQAASGTLKRIDADRAAWTNGNLTTITGGGTIELGGFTLTVPKTGSVAMTADLITYGHFPFYFPWVMMPVAGSMSPAIPAASSTTYTTLLGVSPTSRYETVFNVSNLPSNATVKLRVRMMVSAASTGSVQMQMTNGSAITGSEVTTTSTSYAWVTSGDIKANLNAGATTYRLAVKNSYVPGVGEDGRYTILAGAELVVEVP